MTDTFQQSGLSFFFVVCHSQFIVTNLAEID